MCSPAPRDHIIKRREKDTGKLLPESGLRHTQETAEEIVADLNRSFGHYVEVWTEQVEVAK